MRRDLEREARIMAWRRAGLTYAEIGRRIGVSRERVRQIVQQAVERPRGS